MSVGLQYVRRQLKRLNYAYLTYFDKIYTKPVSWDKI